MNGTLYDENNRTALDVSPPGPGPLHIPAGQVNLKPWHIAKLHCDVDRIRDHGNSLAMSQASGHPRGGGSRRESYRLVFFDQLGSGDGDMPFFLHELLFSRLEGSVIAERFVQKLLNQGCATMSAPDQPF